MGNTTIGIFAASAVLGLVSFWLVTFAVVRHRRRLHEITFMLRRYDDRLAGLAQALDDALAAALATPDLPTLPPLSELTGSDEPEGGVVMRTLELARDRTHAHAAIAAVADPVAAPMLATIGLSSAEAAEVGRMGLPDYRGARALQVSFSGEANARSWGEPIRSGLVVPLFDSSVQPGMLVVLSRSPARRFSDADISELERVVLGARPALKSTLAFPEAETSDTESQRWDRGSFQTLVAQEIQQARDDEYGLALLVLDVDRLTGINTQIGYDAADALLAGAATRLEEVSGRSDLPCEIGGGRFAVLLPRGGALDATRLFDRAHSALGELATAGTDPLSVSGGIAELRQDDDAADFMGRADAALGRAKSAGRGIVMTSA